MIARFRRLKALFSAYRLLDLIVNYFAKLLKNFGVANTLLRFPQKNINFIIKVHIF